MSEKEMPVTQPPLVGDEPDDGKTPASLSATLRSSKLTSEVCDTPLPPINETGLPSLEEVLASPVRELGDRFNKYWLTRAYLSLSCFAKALVVGMEPTSLMHLVLRGNGLGWGLLFTLMAFSLLAIADVVINDLMPKRYRLDFARDARHVGYMLIAICTMALTYAVYIEHGFSTVLLAYWVDAGAAVAVANFDLLARRRGVRT